MVNGNTSAGFYVSLKTGIMGLSVYYEISDLVNEKILIEEGEKNNLKIESIQ